VNRAGFPIPRWRRRAQPNARRLKPCAEDFVERIAPRPLLLIHGIDDTMVRFVEAESLFARAGEPKKLFPISDINHADVYEARNADVFRTVAAETIAWFNAYL
jgi:fermentation-respiration switch protein FrsA (DUF1100 family)